MNRKSTESTSTPYTIIYLKALPYPVRGISDGEYRYLRNLLPDELYIEKHLMGLKGNAVLNNPYWSTWVRDSWENAHTYKLGQALHEAPRRATLPYGIGPLRNEEPRQ